MNLFKAVQQRVIFPAAFRVKQQSMAIGLMTKDMHTKDAWRILIDFRSRLQPNNNTNKQAANKRNERRRKQRVAQRDDKVKQSDDDNEEEVNEDEDEDEENVYVWPKKERNNYNGKGFVEVKHTRWEMSAAIEEEKYFEVEWEVVLRFDPLLERLLDAYMHVGQIRFGRKMPPSLQQQLKQAFSSLTV